MTGAEQRALENRGFGSLAWTLIALGILLGIVKALIWSGGLFNSEVFGYALAGVLIPGAIAYAIAGRAKVRNGKRFASWFVAISAAFLLLELAQVKK